MNNARDMARGSNEKVAMFVLVCAVAASAISFHFLLGTADR